METIGSKGEALEKNWLNELNKSKSEIKEKFNYFNNTIFKDKLNELVSLEKKNIFKKNQNGYKTMFNESY